MSDLILPGSTLAGFLNLTLVVGVALLLWILLAIPSYLLVPLVQRLREELVVFVTARLTIEERSPRPTHGASAAKLAWHHICAGKRPAWDDAISQLAQPLEETRRILDSHYEAVLKNRYIVHGVAERLAEMKIEFPLIPEVPASSEATAQIEEQGESKATWIASTVLLFTLVSVNTGMLSQILRDLLGLGGVAIGPVRLVHILAAALALLEPSLGFLSAVTPAPTRHSPLLRPFPLLWVVVAVVLALMEGVYYAQVIGSDAGNTITVPLFDAAVSMQQAFFIMGFTLPLVLAGLGHVAYRSGMKVSRARASRNLRRNLRKWNDVATHLRALRNGYEEQIAAFTKLRDDAARVFKEPESPLPHKEIELNLLKVRSALDELAAAPPNWLQEEFAGLPQARITTHTFTSGPLLAVAALVATAAVILHVAALAATYPSLDLWVFTVLAIAQAVAFVFAGLVLRPAVIMTDADGRPGLLERTPLRSQMAAVLLLILALVSLNVTAIVRDTQSGEYLLLWAFSLGLEIVLVFMGRDLPSLFAAATASVHSVLHLMGGTIHYLSNTFLRTLVFVVRLIEFALLVFARPIAFWRPQS